MPYFGDPRRAEFDRDPAAEVGSFAWSVYDDVEAVVDMREDLFPRYVEELPETALSGFVEFHELLVPAFEAVSATRDAFIRQILELDAGRLAFVGLGGPELALKLATWQASRDALTRLLLLSGGQRDARRETESPPLRVRPAERIPLMRRIAHRVPVLRPLLITGKVALERADVALGSLVKLAPLGERLVELKEMVESGLGELVDRMG